MYNDNCCTTIGTWDPTKNSEIKASGITVENLRGILEEESKILGEACILSDNICAFLRNEGGCGDVTQSEPRDLTEQAIRNRSDAAYLLNCLERIRGFLGM